MKLFKTLLLSVAITLAIWGIFTWPLPRYVSRGIASSVNNIEKFSSREMISGDHLQLLYHFWLADEMVCRRIPLFANVYEFNTGDDKACHDPGAYYIPFSLTAALLAHVGGWAFGWNLTQFASLWLTVLFTWLLVRRWTDHPLLAWMAAYLSILFMFRWTQVLGGSPAGFALMYPPLVALGLDMAIRDRRIGGGILAGIGILLSAWCDKHVVMFTILATPFFCLLVWLHAEKPTRSDFKNRLRIIPPLLPVGFFILASYLHAKFTTSTIKDRTAVDPARQLAEIGLYSPKWNDLFIYDPSKGFHQTYIGWLLPLVLLTSTLAILIWIAAARRAEWRRGAILVALVLGVAALCLLAMGPHVPPNGEIFVAMRKFIPPYTLVRQPPKVLCLMPTLLALLVVSITHTFSVFSHKPRLVFALGCVIVLLAAVDCRTKIHTTVCLLQPRQDAYAAVTTDAASRGVSKPRAMAIPLWPGDTHNSSIYLSHASHYRIRMLNGYSPTPPPGYKEKVFRPLESMNKGFVSDAQLDSLLAFGISYVFFHEDAFPEKVSPFSSGYTLRSLLMNPRLHQLKQDGPAWAFRILAPPGTSTNTFCTTPAFASARSWQLGITNQNPAATLKVKLAGSPQAGWLVRARGHGSLSATIQADSIIGTAPFSIPVDSADWDWHYIPAGITSGYAEVSLDLTSSSPQLQADLAILTAAPWIPPSAGAEPLFLPAAAMFHTGFTRDNNGTITLLPDHDPSSPAVWGPGLPFLAGRHQVELLFSSPAPAGTLLGTFRTGNLRQPVIAGKPASLSVDSTSSLPLTFSFNYSRNAAVDISGFRITNLTDKKGNAE